MFSKVKESYYIIYKCLWSVFQKLCQNTLRTRRSYIFCLVGYHFNFSYILGMVHKSSFPLKFLNVYVSVYYIFGIFFCRWAPIPLYYWHIFSRLHICVYVLNGSPYFSWLRAPPTIVFSSTHFLSQLLFDYQQMLSCMLLNYFYYFAC